MTTFAQSLFSRQSQTSTVAALEQLLAIPAKPNPALVLWRWRYETALVAGVAGVIAQTVAWVGALAASALLVTAALMIGAGLLMSRGLRRLVRAHAWRIITPHRIRVACRQARITSRGRKLPIVLLSRRRPYGERVLLWCRAGTAAADFIASRELLVTACWAADIRIIVDPRRNHLVTLEVVRTVPPPAALARTEVFEPVPRLALAPSPPALPAGAAARVNVA